LLTGDSGFGDIRNYPPEDYYGIVVFGISRNYPPKNILVLVEEFLKAPNSGGLDGKLIRQKPGRTKLRP